MKNDTVSYVVENDYMKLIRNEILNFFRSEDIKDICLLNIACEYRLVPEFLTDVMSQENCFGLEINEDIVKENDHIKYCNVDEDTFPFPDNTFDIVISIWGMEHFQKQNVFKETCRVLRQGGIFVFAVPNAWYPTFLINKLFGEKLAKFYYKRILKSWYDPHKAYYYFNSYSSVKKAIEYTNLSFFSATYFGPFII
jgi:SAM-dependent methyltransferase